MSVRLQPVGPEYSELRTLTRYIDLSDIAVELDKLVKCTKRLDKNKMLLYEP